MAIGPRNQERRRRDRRGLGVSARRDDDRALNRQRRAFLFDFLKRLPADTLWMWIDGAWLGSVTDQQLAALIESAVQSGDPSLATPSRRRGRPRAPELLPGHSNASVRHDIRALQHELRELGALRRQHYSKHNFTRGGRTKSSKFREAGLASWIGQVLSGVGLFEAFFDTERVPPEEMAVRLLLAAEDRRLMAVEAYAREEAARAPSAERRAWWTHRASQAADHRRRLPQQWKTFHNKLLR